MSAHRARHRAPAGAPSAATRRSARELIDELSRVDACAVRAPRRHRADHGPTPGPAHLPAPRHPRSAMSSTTLTMLAVGAVGASAAMTGTFATITDSTPNPTPDLPNATPMAMDDVLIPATSPDSSAANFSAASLSTQPSSERAADRSTAAAVLAEDVHQTNAREIAALARSVDRERARTDAPAGAEAKTIGGLGVPATLGLGGAAGLVPGAAMRATAMNAALSKLGVPYVWGAAGPKAFDCSGLVLWAFNKVGISLPHSSKAQSRMGKPVSKGELRPGDLVFFYTPVSHVGIYLGNGKVVHASEPGKPVKVSPMNRMPFHNARRL